MMKFRTIRRGDRVAVWNAKGDVRFVDGPKRLCASCGPVLDSKTDQRFSDRVSRGVRKREPVCDLQNHPTNRTAARGAAILETETLTTRERLARG